MALYDDFPYTNFHSLNLDWIVKKLSELENGESSEDSSSTATLAHNLSGNYPYTNFHALNLDWIIRSMVELESDFETLENEWQNLSATGLLNDGIKNAILQCFENVAWVNNHGQQYYDTLHDVFFPPVVVSTLTAVLDQGERVFHTGEDVNAIKDYLTVTAKLSNDTTITVPSTQYVLAGSLSQEGPNIITVTYMNASTTVTVNAIAVNLVSISAVYTQSGTVYNTDTLDSLKNDLVVTAAYDDSSTATVPSTDYTLSGTLAVGTSTITVTYEGLTATFNVTVSERGALYPLTNGTHTFATSGETVTVSNGNHIKIEIPSDLTETTGHMYNLSDLALNNANSSLTANNSANVNNLSNILFNIPANSTAVLTMSNMSVSKNNLFTSGSTSGKQFVCSARKTGTNTSAFTAVGYPNTSTDQFQTTTNIAQSTDIGCFFIYLMGVKANTVEFDLSLTVNGVQYI